MRCTAPALRLLVTLLLGLVAAQVAPTPLRAYDATEAITYLEHLPETNPYRALLLRLAAVPEEDRAALLPHHDESTPPPAPTDAQRALARELTDALIAAAQKPALTAEDWPLLMDPADPTNPTKGTIPSVGLARSLTAIAIKSADQLAPADALTIYAATAQFARQMRNGGASLITHLSGVAMEGMSLSAAARRLTEYSADELLHLSAAWTDLQKAPDNESTLAGERELYFIPIVEHVLRPGLHALLSETDNPDAPNGSSNPDVGFTRDLRLSALVDLGGGERQISLENVASNTTFTLREHAAVEGIELVSLSFEQRQAVIRRGTQEAVINLESREIVERDQAVKKLRELFESFDWLNGQGTGHAALAETLILVRKNPAGVTGYLDDLVSDYNVGIENLITSAKSPISPGKTSLTETTHPLLKDSMPTLGSVARSFNVSSTQSFMLQAAIQHRLGELGQATDPTALRDPWSDDESPFAHEATPDGGFLLRSRYETGIGVPVTYKFAAPDAGFARVAPPP